MSAPNRVLYRQNLRFASDEDSLPRRHRHLPPRPTHNLRDDERYGAHPFPVLSKFVPRERYVHDSTCCHQQLWFYLRYQ
ncbi:unnamed protein product [Pseudo-nitzschia multistriata]|uniref:Uncharacterized protein n=1 Tax=Pseudo-nitzschia multistriata TaxID=183589 RepID=A0A448ZET3_9STRA|nr:unnamed protein product [Pseudo-nitzschia multistriata]